MEKIKIHEELCKSCQFCVSFCPKKVLAIGNKTNGKGYQYAVIVNGDACVGCGICAVMCPDAAIDLYR